MMNYNFFRRFNSSVVASFVALSFGIGSVKPVNAEDTKRIDFCRDNKSLFHINEGAERKVRVAVLDFESSKSIIKNPSATLKQSPIEVTGLGSVIESKLVKHENLDVIKWSKIKTQSTNSNNELKKLRKIRDENGVEAVIIVNVMQFETTKDYQSGWLITTKKQNQEVKIELNLQVIDTTTGKIVLEAQGNGSKRGNTLTEVDLAFEVSIRRNMSGKYDPEARTWNGNSGEYSIEFKLGSNVTNAAKIYKRQNSITEKLVAEATEEAMQQITEKLNSSSKLVLACLLRKPTLVAWVDRNKKQVILNKGKSYGYCEDMTFSIGGSPQPVKDPATGRIIRIKTEKVGEIKLVEVDAQSSVGKIQSGFSKIYDYFRSKTILIAKQSTENSNQQVKCNVVESTSTAGQQSAAQLISPQYNPISINPSSEIK